MMTQTSSINAFLPQCLHSGLRNRECVTYMANLTLQMELRVQILGWGDYRQNLLQESYTVRKEDLIKKEKEV